MTWALISIWSLQLFIEEDANEHGLEAADVAWAATSIYSLVFINHFGELNLPPQRTFMAKGTSVAGHGRIKNGRYRNRFLLEKSSMDADNSPGVS